MKKAEKKQVRKPGRPRTKPAEVRLDELMNAALDLFLAKGFEATTVSDIVEAVDVAKGTFYHYFTSKNEMLEALGQRYTEQFQEKLQEAIDHCSEDDWVGRLRTWIQASVETYINTYKIHDIVYTNHHHHNRLNADKNILVNNLMGIIEGGTKAGFWSPKNPRAVALLIYAGVHGATDEIIAGNVQDSKFFASDLVDSCLMMLLTHNANHQR
ncbi:TetR/AcrR family transcriptional regulator [Bartonella sp. LJL80]